MDTKLLFPILILIAASAAGCVGARQAPIAQWDFDDPTGTALAGVAGPTAFLGSPDGVTTTGDGALLFRREAAAPALFYAPLLPEAFEAPVWLTIEIEEWVPAGKPGEGLRFGFASREEVAGQIVDLRLRREDEDGFLVSGRAGGSAGMPFDSDRAFTLPLEAPQRLALYYDAGEDHYGVFAQAGDGEWDQLGSGRTSPTRGEPAFLRLNLWGGFADAPEEGLRLGRIALSRTAPQGAPEAPVLDYPRITARSWVVHDATAGRDLASHDATVPRKAASTTKMMATLVVLRLVGEDPSLLDERVTYSALAAGTGGSTSGLEEGESLLLRDALRAFMLPSGNDAGNALAEHFNDRLDPPPPGVEVSDSLRTRANFIAEMNREAARLGLEGTIYRSAYGDGGTRDDRTTTAADLLKVARAAMAIPRFREVVGAKEYSALVQRPDGTTREVTWTNTNRFLGEPGFIGIKTGTTRQAGACLVTACEREGREVYVVVLGSRSSDYRYHDTRALLAEHLPGGE